MVRTIDCGPLDRDLAGQPGAPRLLVIESPFAAGGGFTVQDNVVFARAVCRFAVHRGYAPYASHLFYTQPGILDDDTPAERALGIEAGLAWGALAPEVWFCTRSTEEPYSSGMLQGLARVEGDLARFPPPLTRHLVFTADGVLVGARPASFNPLVPTPGVDPTAPPDAYIG